MRMIITLLFVLLLPAAVAAQERTPSHCLALADAVPEAEFLHKASWNTDVADETVRIHYVTHAAFLIRTAGGLNMVTDYTGFLGSAPMIPDAVSYTHLTLPTILLV